jgi:hypothetical protein
MNRAFNRVPRRAEHRQAEQLRDTFVDSGVSAALEAIDHQVLYGRRGTGKTHALRYLETKVQAGGDVAVYADLRTIGSPDGLFSGDTAPPTERAARLLVDLLGMVHEGLLAAALDDETLISDTAFVDKLDALLAAITTVRVAGEVEVSLEGEEKGSEKAAAGARVSIGPRPGLDAQLSAENAQKSRELLRETRRGTERIGLNFADVARSLRELAETLSTKRVWLLLDEWSSVPSEVQPYLGEFLVRCVTPLQMFTVKIAAIEQQTNFQVRLGNGTAIGIELGADVAANIDLDEFMVFEQNEERARSFFRGLHFKHLTAGVDEDEKVEGLNTKADLVRLGFTDKRAFDELVRAAEGVPRDAINIVAKAALRAGMGKVSVADVRAAARAWFQTDKEAALRSRPEAPLLLNWIIAEVIREKRARGFLVNQKAAGAPLLLALFDARVLHLVRRGYSAQDEPGERYDVWVIDYGAYVDLIHTKLEPQGLLPHGETSDGGYVDVPSQDLRAIRRAILDLDKFAARAPAEITSGDGNPSPTTVVDGP